jgi:hypothetical protein
VAPLVGEGREDPAPENVVRSDAGELVLPEMMDPLTPAEAEPLAAADDEADKDRDTPADMVALASVPEADTAVAPSDADHEVEKAVPLETTMPPVMVVAVALPAPIDKPDSVRVADAAPVPPPLLHEIPTAVPVTSTVPLEPMLVKVMASLLAPALAETAMVAVLAVVSVDALLEIPEQTIV